MENAIQKAIEGGWRPFGSVLQSGEWGVPEVYANFYHQPVWLLDPLFWQALGRVEGWADSQEPYACKGCGTIGIMDYNHMNDCPIKDRKLYWCVYWHKFIDHLAEGKSPDEFLPTYLNKMHKIENKPCRKCGGRTSIRWIPSSGMDIEQTGMKRTCSNCGFADFIDSLDKDNKINA